VLCYAAPLPPPLHHLEEEPSSLKISQSLLFIITHIPRHFSPNFPWNFNSTDVLYICLCNTALWRWISHCLSHELFAATSRVKLCSLGELWVPQIMHELVSFSHRTFQFPFSCSYGTLQRLLS
jgi:hypothetical protein